MPRKRGSLVKPDMNGGRDEPASAKRSAAKRKVSLPSQPRPRKLSDGIVGDLPALDSLVLNGKDDSSDDEGSHSEPEESGASSDEGSFDGFLEGDDDDEEDDADEDDDELSFEGDEDADGEEDDGGEESIDGDEQEESLESQLGKLGQVFLANEKKANSRPSSRKSDPVKEEGEAGPSPSAKISLSDPKPSTSSALEQPSTSEPSKPDEYEHDSSDEEDLRNTVGNIPMEWYKDFAHIGYDLDGRRIIKPKQGDELDFFLDKMENPDFWRTVHDKMTGQKVVLSEEDVNLIKRIQKGKVGDATYNPYEPWVDFFTSKVLNMPVTAQPPHKRSFLPSKDEKERVSRLVHAIKKGWLTPKVEKGKEDDSFKFYLLWNAQDEAEPMRRVIDHIPAPKLKLPSHAESYNPPTEYLFNEKEKETWEKLAEEPWRRKYNFMPKKFDCLRKVPAYERFVRERFERCMDLYLAPRARRTRLTIEPEDLMPKLPKPRELQPFPTMQSLIYEGHTDMVRSISTEPTGQFLVSGSDDHTVKIWEVATGRCLKTYNVGAVVKSVAWCPSTTVSLIAVACDVYCYIINPGVGDKLLTTETDALLRNPPEQGDSLISARVKTAVEWQVPTDEQWNETNIRVIVKHFKPVKQVTWHGKGDYFATIMPEGLNRAVIIHQLSKRKSQQPFEKAKGLVQCALFHPIRPYVFVATKSCVRVYNLVKQELSKKLVTSMKWISSMAVHPGGDNILVGTYDTRVQWFDLDLSTKPYKVLRHHRKAVRAVAYHKRYPLFASCSDEGTVTIFHGMVYNDLLQNPLIVPVKVLRGHTIFDDFSVLDCCFHPTQPWVFSSGADFTIRLYT